MSVLVTAISCSPNLKEKTESLVYLSSRDGNFDLYTNDVLGQWERRLTTNEGWDWSPKWNEGLDKLVYYTNDTARNFSVIAITLNSNEVDTLPNSQLSNFQLTPNGERIVYIEGDNENQNIWWCKLDGSDRQQLTNSQSYNGRFSVSPSGNKLLFVSDRSGSNELYLMNLKTKEVDRLTDNNLIEKYNTWSPDGTKIAFTMREDKEGGKEDIYILDLQSKALKQLTNTPYAEQEIAWSLNGDKIAFHGTTDDGDHIYTIDVVDRKFTKITSGNTYHGEPAWIPGDY
ncbi:TolB family protein [Fabibacter sp. E12]|nr:TolB family protein [Roseivirga sp. E12]